jgi:hypothetical protein
VPCFNVHILILDGGYCKVNAMALVLLNVFISDPPFNFTITFYRSLQSVTLLLAFLIYFPIYCFWEGDFSVPILRYAMNIYV